MPSVPQLTLGDREQNDLELLLAGALLPLTGFGPPATGVTLIAPAKTAEAITEGTSVRLLDVEGAPLADVVVSAIYQVPDGVGVIGDVHRVAVREPRPFERLYCPPVEVRAAVEDSVVVPTDRPLSAEQLDRLATAAGGRSILLLALVGAGTPQGLSAVGLIRASLAAAGLLPRARVVAVPLARRDDEHLHEALVQRIVTAYAGPSAPDRTVRPAGDGPLAAPVAAAVRLDRRSGTDRGVVVLFTGLSGSGKSTIARGVRNALLEAGDRTVTMLDGDVVRRHLSAGLGFSRADRDTNIRRIGWVAAEISRHGGLAIASPIAPFAATRSAVRAMVEAAGGQFVLVHVATPLAECERRDRKGLYARARAGEIGDFTGISSPYEEPTDADLHIDTTSCTVDDAVALVLAELRRRELVP